MVGHRHILVTCSIKFSSDLSQVIFTSNNSRLNQLAGWSFNVTNCTLKLLVWIFFIKILIILCFHKHWILKVDLKSLIFKAARYRKSTKLASYIWKMRKICQKSHCKKKMRWERSTHLVSGVKFVNYTKRGNWRSSSIPNNIIWGDSRMRSCYNISPSKLRTRQWVLI